jgi:hypothetical protein
MSHSEVTMRLPETQFSKPFSVRCLNSPIAVICAAFVVIFTIPVVGDALWQQPNPPRNVPEFINRLPDVNDQARMRQDHGGGDYAAAAAYRHKQVSDESEKLLKLATDLKAEVDKSGNDTLSVSALKKVEAIEKLAHSIRQKMTVTPPAN